MTQDPAIYLQLGVIKQKAIIITYYGTNSIIKDPNWICPRLFLCDWKRQNTKTTNIWCNALVVNA